MKKKLSILFLSLILTISTSFYAVYAAPSTKTVNYDVIRSSKNLNLNLAQNQFGTSWGGRVTVNAGETKTFYYNNVGTYAEEGKNAKAIGAKVVVHVTQKYLVVDSVKFGNGYEVPWSDTDTGPDEGEITYSFYYMDDANKTPIKMRGTEMITITSNSANEYTTNLSHRDNIVYVSSDSKLRTITRNGYTYFGDVSEYHDDNYNSWETLNKTTAGFSFSQGDTELKIGYYKSWHDYYRFAPSAYDFGFGKHTLTINYVDELSNQRLGQYIGTFLKDETYSVNSPNFENYVLSDTSKAIISGTMPNNDVTITVYYKNIGFATIEYIDKSDNNSLLEEKRIQGLHDSLIEDTYTTKTQDINNYIDKGYALVSDGLTSDLKFKAGETKTVQIVLEHTYTKVDKTTYEKDECLNNACTVKQLECLN